MTHLRNAVAEESPSANTIPGESIKRIFLSKITSWLTLVKPGTLLTAAEQGYDQDNNGSVNVSDSKGYQVCARMDTIENRQGGRGR